MIIFVVKIMNRTFQAQNVNCKSCANLIKNSLQVEFGKVEVNLDKSPVEVSLFLKNKTQEKSFKKQMKEIGFDVID
jgi:copper chaperone